MLALEALALLREEGFTAVRLEDGVADWKAAGFEVPNGCRDLERMLRASGAGRALSARRRLTCGALVECGLVRYFSKD